MPYLRQSLLRVINSCRVSDTGRTWIYSRNGSLWHPAIGSLLAVSVAFDRPPQPTFFIKYESVRSHRQRWESKRFRHDECAYTRLPRAQVVLKNLLSESLASSTTVYRRERQRELMVSGQSNGRIYARHVAVGSRTPSSIRAHQTQLCNLHNSLLKLILSQSNPSHSLGYARESKTSSSMGPT